MDRNCREANQKKKCGTIRSIQGVKLQIKRI